MKSYLEAPLSYKVTPLSKRRLVCGGCGPGFGLWSKLIPNTFYGLNIRGACDIHDWMYSRGKNLKDKERADAVFLTNLYAIIENETKWNWLKQLRRWRAKKYFYAVNRTYWAKKAYFKGKERG